MLKENRMSIGHNEIENEIEKKSVECQKRIMPIKIDHKSTSFKKEIWCYIIECIAHNLKLSLLVRKCLKNNIADCSQEFF